MAYRNELLNLTNSLKRDSEVYIIALLRQLESQYVKDSYATTLEEAFNRMAFAYTNIGRQASIVSSSFANKANQVHKQRFYKAMEKSIGVDLTSIVQNENLEDILTAATQQNVALIKSIPSNYFTQIERIVYEGTVRGKRAKSLIQEIRELNDVTTKRARLIARDQSSKINSSLTQQRQINLGIEEYIWRTAGDGRVREDHKANNGKTFRWDKPPETGHPGEDVQCRCVAQAIIKL